ncbi:DUF559 domain-containing protein [Aquipuribacter hungaricus]|uniref:DUF559 domain-containing protein n=1 Tax=Aquipuribacter hungaricus TaxID=545624 RepID=A0ABV7WLI6_9MICO
MRWDDLVWTRERALREGVPRERLTGPEFVRVVRGRYLEAVWADDLRARCAAVLDATTPGACLSHWTALGLRGLPVPGPVAGAVHVTVPAGAAVPYGAGVHGHRATSLPVYELEGLPVTGAVRAWCDAAALAPRLEDLVAVGDALARRRPTTRRDIGLVLSARPRGRGTALGRRALALLDERAESPQESRLRVALTLAGLAPPAVNHVVRDAAGRHVARVDLAWPDHRVAVEYDGDHHRGTAQWAADVARREALERLGWVVVVVLAADLRGPVEHLVARISARLALQAA